MTHPISHYPYLTAKMIRLTSFLLFLSFVQAFMLPAYVLPASIVGCYHPDSVRPCILPEDKPINTIEPAVYQKPIIRHHKTELPYMIFSLIGIIMLSIVISSLDYKPKQIDRIHVNNDNNVYYEPLPPILEEDEEEEEQNPYIFHHNHPIITDTCGDPC